MDTEKPVRVMTVTEIYEYMIKEQLDPGRHVPALPTGLLIHRMIESFHASGMDVSNWFMEGVVVPAQAAGELSIVRPANILAEILLRSWLHDLFPDQRDSEWQIRMLAKRMYRPDDVISDHLEYFGWTAIVSMSL